jgi:aerobic-type carbon monoxide dehydrogenase small subunit (CoxS/CutS family)
MHITINGTAHDLDVAGHETLLGVLRDRLSLTGTKLSCGRGECGACTVLIKESNDAGRHPVYSCLTLAAACERASVTTIEGLEHDGDGARGLGGLHPLQDAFIAHDAVQCGFCTPGQILAAAALLDETPDPTELQIRTALSGNLCRCGTYPKIVLAIQEAGRRISRMASAG